MLNLNLDLQKHDGFTRAYTARQGDTGEKFTVTLFDNQIAATIANGATVTFKVVTPSGKLASTTGTISGNVVTFTLDATITSESGYYKRAYVEVKSGTTIRTTQDIVFFSLGNSDINTGQANLYVTLLDQLLQELNMTFTEWLADREDDYSDLQTKINKLTTDTTNAQNTLNNLIALVNSNDLRVASRNYLMNSHFDDPTLKNGWAPTNGVLTNVESKLVFTVSSVADNTRLNKVFDFDKIGDFILAVRVKSTIQPSWESPSGVTINAKQELIYNNGQFNTYYIKFKNTTSGSKTIRLYFKNAPIGTVIEMDWEMLGEGTVVADWLPEPSDIPFYTAYKMADGTFTKTKPPVNLISKQSAIKNPFNVGGTPPGWGEAVSVYTGYVIPVKQGETYSFKSYNATLPTRFVLVFSQTYPNTDVPFTYITDGQGIILNRTATEDGYFSLQMSTSALGFDIDAAKVIAVKDATVPTDFIPSPLDDIENAYPKYQGISARNSTTESDYTWELSDDYLSRLKPAYKMANGDWGIGYPSENLLLNGRTPTISSNDANMYPIANTIVTENGETFRRVYRTSPTLNPTVFSVYNGFNVASIASLIGNKRIRISCMSRCSIPVRMSIMARYIANGVITDMPDNGIPVNVGTDWGKFYTILEDTPTNIATIRFIPYGTVGNTPDLTNVNFDYKNWKIEILDNDSNTIIYTLPPSEATSVLDYKPKYKGLATATLDNEIDYQWSYSDDFIDTLIARLAALESS